MAGDVCVVCEDFKGTGNEGEISVCVGQQVEVLDTSPPGGSEWCLVRPLLSVEGIVGQPCPEGVVPMSILKNLPNLRVSVSRTSINNDGEYQLNYFLIVFGIFGLLQGCVVRDLFDVLCDSFVHNWDRQTKLVSNERSC